MDPQIGKVPLDPIPLNPSTATRSHDESTLFHLIAPLTATIGEIEIAVEMSTKEADESGDHLYCTEKEMK